MVKHLFVINPTAGDGKNAGLLVPKIRGLMERLQLDYTIVTTEFPHHATEIVRALSLDDSWRVYSCGGDGTMNDLLTGIVGKPNIALGVYPCGTGNDFVRTFGGGNRFLDLEKQVTASEQLLDCMTLDENRYALNICSVGIDADVAAEMPRFKWALAFGSKIPYVLSLVYCLTKGFHRPYEVTVDGKHWDGEYTMLTACNGQVYGGGFNACPDAQPNDGILEFLLVKKVSLFTLTKVVKVYASGGYATLSDIITHVRGHSLSFSTAKPTSINYDGEIFKKTHSTIALSIHKIRFILPGMAPASHQVFAGSREER